MKKIAIYPGNFQPPHKGHYLVYKDLRKTVGPDVFVVSSDKTPTAEAPLNIGDKEQIWVRHGVPASHFIKVNDWKKPSEVFERFSPENTVAIFGLNQKEFDEVSKRKAKASQLPDADQQSTTEPNKEIWLNQDGTPSYFQPYRGNENTQRPLKEVGYVKLVDDSYIEGRPVSTANLRTVLGSKKYSDEQKKKFFGWAFGWFDVGLYNIMVQKFKMAHQVAAPDEVPTAMPSAPSIAATGKHQLQNMVRECLKELLEGSLDDDELDLDTSMSDLAGKDKSDAEKRKEKTDTTADLVQQKRDHEMEKRQHDAQAKRDELSYLNYRKITKPADVKKAQELDKQINMAKSAPTL